MFGLIYGSILTAGAFGFYGFNEILFAQIFEVYAEADRIGGPKQLKEYGEWNEALFGIGAAGAFISFMLSLVTWCSMKVEKDRKSTSVVF